MADTSLENHSGEMFSVLVVPVTENPVPGSDEIDKAFDEGWIGNCGYIRSDGKRQSKAIAFQGNTRNKENKTITEVFVADLPDDLLTFTDAVKIEGTAYSRPETPKGISIRRITRTEKGISGPRFWLRTNPDGDIIGFLSPDSKGIIQVFGVTTAGGDIKQLTHNDFPVQGPFNFSPDGLFLAYCSDNRIFISDLKTGKATPLTQPATDKEKPFGAAVFSNDGKMIAYNKYVTSPQGDFAQIFIIKIARD